MTVVKKPKHRHEWFVVNTLKIHSLLIHVEWACECGKFKYTKP